jgi:hypothetical protein
VSAGCPMVMACLSGMPTCPACKARGYTRDVRPSLQFPRNIAPRAKQPRGCWWFGSTWARESAYLALRGSLR